MQAPPRRVRARRGRVRPFRACPGHALLRCLPGREPGRRRAAAGRAVVVLQRAQPAGVATAAVRAPRTASCTRRRPCDTARWSAREPPPCRATGHGGGRDAARRDGPDRPHHRRARHAVRRPEARSCARCCASERAAARRPRCAAACAPGVCGSRASPTIPYSRGGSRPPSRKGDPATEITLASAGRLERLLDAAAEEGRLPEDLPVHYTEYGFQSDPPDGLLGRPARTPGGVPQPVRLDRVPRPAGPHRGAVQADRRPRRRGLPVRPALRRRAREAGL